MINCFGMERIAAIEKVITSIPHVENIAVVTRQKFWVNINANECHR